MSGSSPSDPPKDPSVGPDSDDSVLRFGDYRLDRSARRLTKGDTQVRIQQKPLDVLVYLADNRSRLVTRDEFLDRYWHPR